MKAKSLICLKVLINRYNAKAGQALLKFLSPEETQDVASQEIRSTDILPLLMQPQQVMERLHYSWIQPLFAQFPKNLYPAILASLTPEQIIGLQQRLSIDPLPSIASPVKTFFIHRLYQVLNKEDLLPLEYLQETEFTPLAHWSKNQLVTLIDFLGVHDLAAELRHIVNKVHFNNLASCLSSKQQYYLKICLHQKDQLIAPKLGINPAEKDCKKLKTILHQRGLIRLSKALAGQHHNLVWLIAHRLDVGRGRWLLNYYQSSPIPNVTSILKLQVTNLMNFLKKDKV